VLFRSSRDGYMLTDAKLYTVPVGGGAATALPMPVSGAGDFSPDGTRIAYSPCGGIFAVKSATRAAGQRPVYNMT